MGRPTKHTMCECCYKDCTQCPISTAAWLSLVVVLALLGVMMAVSVVIVWWLDYSPSVA